MEKLQTLGVGKLFGPGTSTADLVQYIKDWFAQHEARRAQEV
jgi:methylmalonyl-CoA mutase C-terminal domain/subunit